MTEPGVNVAFSAGVYRFIQEISAKRGVSETEIIGEAVGVERWYQKALEEGGKMLVEEKNGRLWELVEPYGRLWGE